MLSIFKRFFEKKDIARIDFSALNIDLHSHLIPGIDDGAATIEESVQLASELVKLGFTKAITTPHIISDSYRNTAEGIIRGLKIVQQALKEAEIPLEVQASAEYYLDEAFTELLAANDILAFGGEKKYLLFETSYVNKPLSLQTEIFEMKTRGYTPIMAHPERYNYFWNAKFEDLKEVYDLGVKFQVNISSFAGDHGERASKIAHSLAAESMIDFLGTDLHRKSQILSISRAFQNSIDLRNLVKSGRLLNPHL